VEKIGLYNGAYDGFDDEHEDGVDDEFQR